MLNAWRAVGHRSWDVTSTLIRPAVVVLAEQLAITKGRKPDHDRLTSLFGRLVTDSVAMLFIVEDVTDVVGFIAAWGAEDSISGELVASIISFFLAPQAGHLVYELLAEAEKFAGDIGATAVLAPVNTRQDDQFPPGWFPTVSYRKSITQPAGVESSHSSSSPRWLAREVGAA